MDTDDRQARIKTLEAAAEQAYDELYEAHSWSGCSDSFSDVKEFLCEAIRLATGLGLAQETGRLEPTAGSYSFGIQLADAALIPIRP